MNFFFYFIIKIIIYRFFFTSVQENNTKWRTMCCLNEQRILRVFFPVRFIYNQEKQTPSPRKCTVYIRAHIRISYRPDTHLTYTCVSRLCCWKLQLRSLPTTLFVYRKSHLYEKVCESLPADQVWPLSAILSVNFPSLLK